MSMIKKNWGLQGCTYFLLFLLQKIDCEYLLEPTINVLNNNENIKLSIFTAGKISLYIACESFVMLSWVKVIFLQSGVRQFIR